MAGHVKFLIFSLISIVLLNIVRCDLSNLIDEDVLTSKAYVFWPNATIPFYIDQEHFDKEQSISIMKTLSLFAFKTCLKFAPVMARPQLTDHVLLLENPTGVRKCSISSEPHSIEEPHSVILGYDCLKSPEIDMMIMKALGFPFEHNRAIRDLYIEVQTENVEPSFTEFFTRDLKLPLELRAIAYDPNSVMHFGEREFSKNGHRTIIFKNQNFRQERCGLSPLDLRKIDVVYGPECRKRDRQEKIELCQNYPGVVRRKRDATMKPSKSLRVNPDITPPPALIQNSTEPIDYADEIIKELDVDKEVEDIVEKVNALVSVAFAKARQRLCTPDEKQVLRTDSGLEKPKILDVIGEVASYAKELLEKATQNRTEFCAETTSVLDYQRASCPFFNKDRCPKSYKSTKSGNVKYSTKHLPHIRQSTKPQYSHMKKNVYEKIFRSHNDTQDPDNVTDTDAATPAAVSNRRKREVSPTTTKLPSDLRMGNTKIIPSKKKSIYVPYYRSANESASKVEKSKSKREVNAEETVVEVKITSPKGKDKIDTVIKKSKKADSTVKRRRFENQRFRSKKEVLKRGSYERGLKERQWDNSGLSAERKHQEEEERQTERKGPKVRNVKKRQFAKENSESAEKKPASNEKDIGPVEERPLEKPRKPSKFRGDEDSSKPMPVLPRVVELNKKNREFYDERKWPDGVVRYVLKDTGDGDVDLVDTRNRLDEVNQLLKRRTCARLEELTEEEADNYEDYLVLDNSPDFVTGRVGGKQNFGVVELLKGGQHRQHAAMMVMAMLGFYFEVSRHDRDGYIRVHTRHVRPDKLHHFEKIREDATFPLPYDYKSATHPAWQFWRQIGRTGISTVATFKSTDPDGSVMKSLGQNRQLLSDLDIVKINSVYGIECFMKGLPKGKRMKQTEEEIQEEKMHEEERQPEEDEIREEEVSS